MPIDPVKQVGPRTYTKDLIIVVVAGFVNQANNIIKSREPEGGDVFTAALSATGSGPATHYWCAFRLTEVKDNGLRNVLNALVNQNRVRLFDKSVTTPQQVLTTMGLQRIRGGVNG